MKSLLSPTFALMTLLLAIGPAGAADPELFEVTEVIEVPEVTADVLYDRARIWFAESLVDSKDGLELEDRDGHMLLGKATVAYSPTVLASSSHTVGHVRFAVKVQTKDGRVRLTLTNFTHTANTSIGQLTTGDVGTSFPPGCTATNLCKGWLKQLHSDVKTQAVQGTKGLPGSLAAALRKDAKKADDW